MLMNGYIAINPEGALIDADGVIPDYDKLPVYEVEFIPIERRVTERCSPLLRINSRTQFGERRVSPGRRAVDIEMAFSVLGLVCW
jgi:hypothetical protein